MVSTHTLAQTVKRMYEKDDNAGIDTFLRFLEERRLIHMLPLVVKRLKHEATIDERAETLLLKTAHPLAGDIRDRIVAYLDAKDARRVEESVEPDLIGGFSAEFRGKRYDANVQNDLRKLNEALTRT